MLLLNLQIKLMNVNLAYITVNKNASIYQLNTSVPAMMAMPCREMESTVSPIAMQTSQQKLVSSTPRAGPITTHRASTASGTLTSQQLLKTPATLLCLESTPLPTGWKATALKSIYSSLMDWESMQHHWGDSVGQLHHSLLLLLDCRLGLCF